MLQSACLYLCEIKVLFESHNHVSIDVDFLLDDEVIWTNVTTRYRTFPCKLHPLKKQQYGQKKVCGSIVIILQTFTNYSLMHNTKTTHGTL